MAATAMLEKFQVAISLQPVVHFMFCSKVGFSGTADLTFGAISDSNKFKMAAVAILDNFE